MSPAEFLRRAQLNLKRAKKCRELRGMIANQEAIGILEEYAVELEARAAELMQRAKAIETAAAPGLVSAPKPILAREPEPTA